MDASTVANEKVSKETEELQGLFSVIKKGEKGALFSLVTIQ